MAPAPQSKPVIQASSPRDAQCAVGGMRAWSENPGRGADWLARYAPRAAVSSVQHTVSDAQNPQPI